jgi:hypothetical protein
VKFILFILPKRKISFLGLAGCPWCLAMSSIAATDPNSINYASETFCEWKQEASGMEIKDFFVLEKKRVNARVIFSTI